MYTGYTYVSIEVVGLSMIKLMVAKKVRSYLRLDN